MTEVRNLHQDEKLGKVREPYGDATLAAYLEDIADSNPLSAVQEAALARRIRSGDQLARNELVEANLRFVVSVAKNYQNRGLSLNELISAGNDGLITASERFDETKGFKFISYAVWWIRQAILQVLMEQSTVRIPVNRINMITRISRTYELLRQQGKATTTHMVANTLGCSEEEVEQTLVNGQPVRSMNTPLDDGSERCLHDSLSEEGQVLADEEMFKATLQKDLESALQDLNWREAEILRLYFGIGRDRPMTLAQIGIHFELTRERVRQFKELGLSKLRHPRFLGRLRAYAEN